MALQYYGEDPEMPQEQPPAAQAAAPRWSYHLANKPDWVTPENEQMALGWYNDQGSDPNAKVQQYLGAQRASGPTDAGDATALANIGKPMPNASPTQQWNAQPSGGGGRDALFAQLMARAQQGTAVNASDPNIRQQVDPFVAQQERASRNYLDDVAERSGPLANLQGERRLASERTGQAAGQFEAEIIGREIAAKRDEITQSLSLWGSLMSNEQRMGLEQQLAQLNDRARTADRGQNNDQFLKELALREYLGQNQVDLSWASL